MGWAARKYAGERIRCVLLAALLMAAACGAPTPAAGQAPPTDVERAGSAAPAASAGEVRWRLVTAGSEPISLDVRHPVDSLAAVVDTYLLGMRRQGHLYARLDSAVVEPTPSGTEVLLYYRPGPAVLVHSVEVLGARAIPAATIDRLLETRPGRPLDASVLERDLEAILDAYDAAGRPLAQVTVDSLSLAAAEPPSMRLVLRVEEGGAVTLRRLELPGATRTRAGIGARLAGVRPGALLTAYDPEDVRRGLQESGLFEEVGMPELVAEGDSGVVLRVPVEEADPGTFDLVLGYLPAEGGSGGRVVGNGHLELHNPVGMGRQLAVRLRRMPGQVSAFEAEGSDPFVAGLPIRLDLRFAGMQQDSTFGKHAYGLEAAYRLGRRVQLGVSLSRELTRPGNGGMAWIGGRQRVARAGAAFAGVTASYRSLDRPRAPSRGSWLRLRVETGRKEGRYTGLVDGDTAITEIDLRQLRVRAESRLYRPLWRRHIFVAGADAALLVSDAYDRSDLFRFGGATTLRGYDEERFLGRAVGRALAEYRVPIDRESYAFLFLDVGYVDTPSVGQEGIRAARGVHPGYGMGLQFGTNLGLVNVSAAFNPSDGPTAARIHAGLSFGL